MRLKSDELISNLQFIVAEYEQGRKEAAGSANSRTAELQETIQGLKGTVARLEEKNETLLVSVM